MRLGQAHFRGGRASASACGIAESSFESQRIPRKQTLNDHRALERAPEAASNSAAEIPFRDASAVQCGTDTYSRHACRYQLWVGNYLKAPDEDLRPSCKPKMSCRRIQNEPSRTSHPSPILVFWAGWGYCKSKCFGGGTLHLVAQLMDWMHSRSSHCMLFMGETSALLLRSQASCAMCSNLAHSGILRLCTGCNALVPGTSQKWGTATPTFAPCIRRRGVTARVGEVGFIATSRTGGLESQAVLAREGQEEGNLCFFPKGHKCLPTFGVDGESERERERARER